MNAFHDGTDRVNAMRVIDDGGVPEHLLQEARRLLAAPAVAPCPGSRPTLTCQTAEVALDRLEHAMARLTDCADRLEEAMPDTDERQDSVHVASCARVRDLVRRLRARRRSMGDLASDWKEHVYCTRERNRGSDQDGMSAHGVQG